MLRTKEQCFAVMKCAEAYILLFSISHFLNHSLKKKTHHYALNCTEKIISSVSQNLFIYKDSKVKKILNTFRYI